MPIIPASGAKARLTFQHIAARLPKDKLKRLGEIKKAYPHISLHQLPDGVKREVEGILQSGMNAKPVGLGQTGYNLGVGSQASQHFNTLFSVIGQDLENSKDVSVYQKDRTQGLYIIGTTGTGKSTLIANLILTDIKQGLGVCLIEPHGDLTNTVLAGIPDNRLSDVIYLDITDSEYPFGLNLFQCPEPRTIAATAKTASFVHHVFEKLWGAGTETPRLMHVLRAVTRTLIENPATTFAEIPLLFSSDTVRAKMVGNVSNSSIVSFWEDFALKSSSAREVYIESVKNKVMSFLDEPMVRNIVAQSETTINFRSIMDEGKILLVKLSPQFKEVSLLIGAIIIGKLLMAAWSREDTDEDKRRQFNLYCDEYQRFSTSDLKSFIDEARKFRVAITLSHQTLSQLDEENRNAATGAANMIAFRVTGEDGKALAKNFDTTPTQVLVGQEPDRALVSDVIGHLTKRGHSDARVTRFAQNYLQNVESFVQRHYGYYPSDNLGSIYYIYLTSGDILRGKELLTDSLYRSMDTKDANLLIAPLALYILAIAQRNGIDGVLERFIKTDWLPLPPRFYQGFKKSASALGHPDFVRQESVDKFLANLRYKDKGIGKGVVDMIRELRYTMQVLTEQPILVDTGQYKRKYQDRTYADMENEIASRLTQQPNFQAKVKVLSGEHDIRTRKLQSQLAGSGLAARIRYIKAQMRAPGVGYCRHYLDVEKEIEERQEKWRGGGVNKRRASGPPPTYV